MQGIKNIKDIHGIQLTITSGLRPLKKKFIQRGVMIGVAWAFKLTDVPREDLLGYLWMECCIRGTSNAIITKFIRHWASFYLKEVTAFLKGKTFYSLTEDMRIVLSHCSFSVKLLEVEKKEIHDLSLALRAVPINELIILARSPYTSPEHLRAIFNSTSQNDSLMDVLMQNINCPIDVLEVIASTSATMLSKVLKLPHIQGAVVNEKE